MCNEIELKGELRNSKMIIKLNQHHIFLSPMTQRPFQRSATGCQCRLLRLGVWAGSFHISIINTMIHLSSEDLLRKDEPGG